MVTAELAVCLPVLMLLLGAALSIVAVGAAQVRAQDAAAEAARAAARGDSSTAERLASDAAPGSRLHLSSGDGEVSATTTATVSILGGLLPGVTVVGRAVAALEPSSAPP